MYKKKLLLFFLFFWPFIYLFPYTIEIIDVGNDFELLYPSGSDNDDNSWITIVTAEGRSAASQGYRHSDKNFMKSTDGNFIFNKAHYSVANSVGGQTAGSAGNLISYRGKDENDDPYNDGGSGGDQPS